MVLFLKIKYKYLVIKLSTVQPTRNTIDVLIRSDFPSITILEKSCIKYANPMDTNELSIENRINKTQFTFFGMISLIEYFLGLDCASMNDYPLVMNNATSSVFNFYFWVIDSMLFRRIF